MSVTVNAVTRDRVTFTVSGVGAVWMPAYDLVETFVAADHSDDARACHDGHWFRRDDLGAVVSRLVDEFPCENPAHHLSGTNYPGLHDMGRGRFFCRACCSANETEG